MSTVSSPSPTPTPSAIGDVQAGGEEAGGQALLTSASLGCTYLEESFGAFRIATLRDGSASGDSRSGAQGTPRVEGRAAREQGSGWREMGGRNHPPRAGVGKGLPRNPPLGSRVPFGPVWSSLGLPPCHPLGPAWARRPGHIPLIGVGPRVLKAGPAHPPLWHLGFEVSAERALAVSSFLSFRLHLLPSVPDRTRLQSPGP